MNDKYYLVDRIQGYLYCYCKDSKWRYYTDCELNNFQNVLVGNSKEIYEVRDSLTTDNQRFGFQKDDKWVRSLSKKMIFVKVLWDDLNDCWEILEKVLAESWWEACKLMGVDPEKGTLYTQVLHYSNIQGYEIIEAVDKFPLTFNLNENF